MRSEKPEKTVAFALALTFTSWYLKIKPLKTFPSLIRLAGKLNQDFVLAENLSMNEMEAKGVVFWMTAQQPFQEKDEITFIS